MALRMSTLFARTLKEDPVDAEVASHKLLHRGSYIRRAAPGIYTWLPLGLEVLRRIEGIVRQEMVAAGSQEVHFPALLPAGPYEASGRWETYGDGIFRLKDRKEADYLLAPTHEELFTLLVKDLYSSYKDLPLSIFQIQTKYRDEARPRAGLLRGREFIMKDAYSFNIDDAGLDESYQIMREAYIRIYERLGLPYVIVEATSGAMGGSGTEEFLYPSEVGEDTYVRTAGGYAANVEAVTTLIGEPLDASDAPAAHKETTPGANTIASLVDVSNELFAREDRPWEAGDMMKLVMCTLVHPDGQREVIAIGLPGDREVDLDRAAGSGMLSSGEIDLEPATPEDLAKHPDIVAGYIGPGTSLEDQVLGSEGSSGVRFFVDPRITREGSRWVAGGNEAGTHVYDLILGRDFTVDGVLEVAEVREGDPAPDGSGPLELARGVEIGQIFKLGTRYAEALDLKVLDENGKTQVVTMGSYGVGVTRAMACIAEENHDDKGLIWPQHLAPADVHIVATGKGAEPIEAAEKITAELESMGVRVLLDDRPKASPGVKFGDAELLGVPTILVVGRGLAEGKLELRDRRTGEATDVPVEDAVARTVEAIDAKYAELGAKRGEL